jgi:hypothetical protein
MEECYPKKLARPEIVYSDSTPVFGFLRENVCSNLGISSKNICNFSNCEFVNPSTN